MAHGVVITSWEIGEYLAASCENAILFVGIIVVVSWTSEDYKAWVVPSVVSEVVRD